jgi:transposase
MIALIEAEQPDLWAAYQLKERLRLILHMRDAGEAAAQLGEWIEDASSCGLAPMEKLAEKIARHRESILNSVRLQANSAKSEACNTTIKALIKMARGFRNLDNMVALIYLKCSDLVVPLHNRPQPSAEWQKRKRDEANERRRAAEELRRIKVAA